MIPPLPLHDPGRPPNHLASAASQVHTAPFRLRHPLTDAPTFRALPLLLQSVILGLLLANVSASAATVSWVGPSTGNLLWSSPSNWEGGRLPGATDDVRINGEGTSLTVQVTGIFTVHSLDSTANLRIVSDIGVNAALTVTETFINRGTLRLQSERPDRTALLSVNGTGGLDNRGLLWVVAQNNGGRRINGGISNRGRIQVDSGISLSVGNRDHLFASIDGRIDATGSMAIEEGRVEVTGGLLAGDIRLFSTAVLVSGTATNPATLRLLGVQSSLISNASPASTLRLDTDIGNNTTLTTAAGAVNDGRIILGSARSDRGVRVEVGAGFTNRPTGVIECIADAGGDRFLNGTLVNQGVLSSTGIPLIVSGTYQTEAGRADGDVRFVNCRIVPVRATPTPTSLQLFGPGTVLAADVVSNLTMRVISDVGANAVLTFGASLANRGTISLESQRPDRVTTLDAASVVIDNRGVIQVVEANAGGRRLRGNLTNRGQLNVDAGTQLDLDNNGRVFNQEAGRINAAGTLAIDGGRVNMTAGQVSGTVRIYNAATLVASTLTSPTTIRLIGISSTLVGNNSASTTLILDTEAAFQTTVTTSSGAGNEGRIVLSSSRSDRTSRLELGAGFLNRDSGVIEALSSAGGNRFINGTLVNQGLLVATDIPVTFTGTYQSDGGGVSGEVNFLNARIVPGKASPQPVELRLFGGGSQLPLGSISNLVLRVIGDIGANAVLTLGSNAVNQGTIRLETLRSDRNASIRGADGTVVNGESGLISVSATSLGGRSIDNSLRNRGTIALDYPLTIAGFNAQHLNTGRIELRGQTLTVAGSSFINGQGGRIVGSGSIVLNGVPLSNAGILSPGASPGRIAISGNFIQADTGILDIEVASASGPGTGHDIVEITGGSATLNGGILSTRVLGNYLPEAETRFRVLSASGGLTGRFARTPNLQVLPNRYFQAEYLPTALDLRTLAGVNTTLPPSIVIHPASQSVDAEAPVTFSVAANGAAPLAYQWRFNGQPIPGATGITLSIPRALAGSFGAYDVVVSNTAGSSTSDAATLSRKSTGQNLTLDYGDSQDAPYPTTLAHGGASQRVEAGFSLGASVDADDGTLQNSTATADGADEDGVQFLDPLVQGQVVRIRVTYTRPAGVADGRLSAWIDWNANGSWAEAGERIINDRLLGQRTNDFNVVVPATAVVGLTHSRFRLYQDQYPGFSGASAEAGEVEDYRVEIISSSTGGGDATRDFGDAPDTYQTLLASDGPRHLRDPELYLGKLIDLETNGHPSVLALGDDIAGQPDDEDGVTGSPLHVAGGTATFSVSVTGNGKVDAWFDFNRDGDFGDANERVLTGEVFNNQTRSFTIQVPTNSVPGGSYARFRLSRLGVNTWFGAAPDGEVEDYPFVITGPLKDWGDAPENYPTTLSSDGARHTIAEGFHLGKSIDPELDGQPSANATGDDLTPAGSADDEDGVTFTTTLIAGQAAEVQVEVSADGRLDAWIDFAHDGSWSQASDRIFTSRQLLAGRNTLGFTVPANARAGATFARFRLSRAGVNTYTGDGGDGEVEDYRVVIDDGVNCELGCSGTDFWLTFPGNLAPDPAVPVTPRLRFTGANGTTVTVAVAGLGLTLVTNIAGGGATVTLPATVDLGNLNDSVANRGIHVTATAPVGLFAISQVHFTSDGFHALPTEVLSGDYVVSAYPNTQVGVPEVSGSQFAVVATRAQTTVVITPAYETGLRLPKVPYTIVLTNVGDCYQLRNTNDAPADLTGTIIEADQPVSVFGGHVCGNVNSANAFYCDYLAEQMLPTDRLGSEYYTAPLATRSGGETVRIVAARRDTEVTVNGVSVTLTNRGDIYETLLTQAGQIVANKPIQVSQFASSSDFDGVVSSDPFMVTVPSRSHFTGTHIFATAGTNFTSHYVSVVVPSGVTSMTLDGTVVSPAFTNIQSSGFKYAHLAVAQGIHTLSASATFGAIVYGWNVYDAYGWDSCLFFGDTTPPHLTCATNSVTVRLGQLGNDVPCKSRVPDLRQFVSVRDDCGISDNTVVTQDPAPGSLVGVGEHEVTFSAADNRGNVGYCTITLNIVDPAPGSQVSLTCPADMRVRCQDEQGATVNYTVEALRGCTPIAVECTPPSGSRFPIGTTLVTCRITEPGVPVQVCTFHVTLDCSTTRRVHITVPVRPPATPENPNPVPEMTVEWDPESSVILEAAEQLTGPWVTIPTGRENRYVIKVLNERGRFFRLKAGQ